jgi:hypothetical protein
MVFEGLRIRRPVENFTQDHVDGLHEGLNATLPEGAQVSKRIFIPAQGLGAVLLHSGELLSLKEAKDIDISVDRVDELRDEIRQALGVSMGASLYPETLPAEVDLSKGSTYLCIAINGIVLAEREMIRETARKYYGLKSIPENVWAKAIKSAVRIAGTKRLKERDAICKTKNLLRNNPTLLPSVTQLGPIDLGDKPK